MDAFLLHIIESDTLTRDALGLYLGKSESFRTLWSGPHEAYARSRKLEPDLIVIGQRPGVSFADSLKELRLQSTQTPIALLGFDFSAEDLTELLSLPQIRGFLKKDEIKRDVGGALRRIAAGSTVFTASVAQTVMQSNGIGALKQPELVYNTIRIDESRETDQTLLLFAVFGFSKEEIADELCISINTVSSRIRTGYARLGVTNRHEAFEALTSVQEDPLKAETYVVL